MSARITDICPLLILFFSNTSTCSPKTRHQHLHPSTRTRLQHPSRQRRRPPRLVLCTRSTSSPRSSVRSSGWRRRRSSRLGRHSKERRQSPSRETRPHPRRRERAQRSSRRANSRHRRRERRPRRLRWVEFWLRGRVPPRTAGERPEGEGEGENESLHEAASVMPSASVPAQCYLLYVLCCLVRSCPRICI